MSTELNLADLGLPVTLKLEIEGKLRELDVYIDEELPDYILVLLANKKSQAQMCKDLRLFFGSLTEPFVQWLHSSVKDMKTETKDKQQENSEVTKKEIEENSNLETKSKRKRLPSSHSDKSDVSSTVKSPLTSPKNKIQEISIKDSNSVRKRRSRTPEPPKKAKPRIHQEVVKYLTSRKRSTTGEKLDMRSHSNSSRNTDIKDTGHSNKYIDISSPPSNTRDVTDVSPLSDVVSPKETRVREKMRGRERHVVVEREDKRRFRSRSTPISPTLKKPLEDTHSVKRGRNQPKLRYFNTKRSPSPPPLLQQHTSRRSPFRKSQGSHQQLSSVVKIKSSRDIRTGRSITIQDEQKGSIRLVHKALTEAAASTARGFPHNTSSSRKRRGVMERLGPQVDNSSLVRISPDRNSNALLPEQSHSDSIPSKQQANLSDSEADVSSRSIDPIKAQFDVIKLSRTDSSCYISDDDLFPPREERNNRNNTAKSDTDMFDPETVIDTKRRVHPIKIQTKPKFIVTLDGAQHYRQVVSANSNSEDKLTSKLDIKQRLGIKANELPEEINTPLYTPPDISPLSETLKATNLKPNILASTPKPIEPVADRCKFWPNCKLADKCEFHHPSLPCKSFPYCKFNQKCYFIHPDCKFDPYCTKQDCPFLHRHVRTAKPQNHFKNTYSYTPDSKSAFPTRSQLTWTPGQKVVKEKEEDTGRHISERKFALEDVQTVLIPKPES